MVICAGVASAPSHARRNPPLLILHRRHHTRSFGLTPEGLQEFDFVNAIGELHRTSDGGCQHDRHVLTPLPAAGRYQFSCGPFYLMRQQHSLLFLRGQWVYMFEHPKHGHVDMHM